MADATTSVAVHRCRFIDFSPSAITALAFPPLPLPSHKVSKSFWPKNSKFGCLAVGRANGNIDLCEWTDTENGTQSPQAWAIRKTLIGLYPSKVDSLVFVIRHPYTLSQDDVPSIADLRLFSSGGGSELLEWDMQRLCIRRTINSQGGTIWSVAANPSSTVLALGCEDGTVRLVSVADDTLTHYRRFDRVKSRILSLSWGPAIPKESSSDEEDTDEEWVDSWLVAGCSDSSLRKWDVSSGRVLDRMGTDKIRGERTLVWTVAALGDGTIVSGDSLGMVKFWDSRTGTQMHSFQAHGADVLCLTISPDGSAVYSSGVDQRIIQFSLVKTSKADSDTTTRSSNRWVQSSSRRVHAHDVRALAIWPSYTPLPSSHRRQFLPDIAPIIASGGLDMSVAVIPAALPSSTLTAKVINPLATSVHATFEDSYHRRLAYSSGPSSTCAIRIARQARLVSCMHDAGATFWRILKKPSLSEEDVLLQPDSASADWEKCLEMDLNVHTNLVASAISDDGRWFVISDMYETKLFILRTDSEGRLKPRRIKDFTSILRPHLPSKPASTGGLAFAFTPDSTKLIMSVAMSSLIFIIEIGEGNPRLLRKFEHHRQRTNFSANRVVKDIKDGDSDIKMTETDSDSDEDDENTPLLVNVLRIAVSHDGQWLATSDDHCRTHVFSLDSLQHHCVLPSFAQPAQFLTFDLSQPSLLVLAFPNNSFQIYDVESRQFPQWSREICNNLPKRFTHAHDSLMGVAFEPSVPDALSQSPGRCAIFWGSTWLCKINFDSPNLVGSHSSKKRRRDSTKQAPTSTPHKNDAQPEDQKEFRMITHYRPMLFVDFIAPKELVIVERPLVDVLATLPPAYFKHKYGVS